MINSKPIIGITMGDPAGVGPEIAARALATDRVYAICRPMIIGDAGVIRQGITLSKVRLSARPISDVAQAEFHHGMVDVFDLKNVDMDRLEYGKISALAGNAAFEAIKKAIELALDKKIDATVTGPIHKEALHQAGHNFSGHTEIFAHYTNTKDYAMMLAEGTLRVVHVSTHVSLREACERVRKDRIVKVIQLAHDACRKMGISEPRIGVAALNPHASDGGLFGREEKEQIIPAIEVSRSSGFTIDGPVPADTLFSLAKGGRYDVVIAMYHDQGHIPVKFSGFIWNDSAQTWSSLRGVNVTLGLPIIRTSVDHGTALGIAGQGIAIAESMNNAIEYAVKMAGGSG